MRQGADRAALKERKDDLYETPEVAVRALLRHWEPPNAFVWEPCAGRGAISRILVHEGYIVSAQDLVDHPGKDDYIKTNIDFLMETTPPMANMTIITNPPYKLADQFIRHGLSLGCPFVALLRLMAIEGSRKSDIMAKCSHIFAGIERLPMLHRDGWLGPKQVNSTIPYGWFVFNPEHNGDTILRRISWRG